MKKLALVFALFPLAAHAAECPADHPIKRTVPNYRATVQPVATYCPTELKCPRDGDPLSGAQCYYSTVCPAVAFTPKTIEECFTQEEIDKATR